MDDTVRKISADDINPRYNWGRALPALGTMGVDFEERVDYRRLHRYRLSRVKQALEKSELGALLVFDEVITGFRVSGGGAQELTGVIPDLTVMGKVIGGGLPAAAYGGPVELMERIAPAGDVYQAGTLSGNPLATAAGLWPAYQATTLRIPEAIAYE